MFFCSVDVVPGEDAVLQCQAPSSAKVTVVEWTKDDHSLDDYLFLYRNGRSYEKYQHPSFRGRVELRSSSFADSGDVSVVLKNVSVEDMGTYRCRVLMTSIGGKMEEHSEVVHLRNQIPSGIILYLVQSPSRKLRLTVVSDLQKPPRNQRE